MMDQETKERIRNLEAALEQNREESTVKTLQEEIERMKTEKEITESTKRFTMQEMARRFLYLRRHC